MQKKLTITLDEEIYEGLRRVIGPRKISRFIEDLVRPYILHPDLEAGYRAMAVGQSHVKKAEIMVSQTPEEANHAQPTIK